MKILPLKSEVSAVRALLESGDFETADGLAREIVKTVATELAKRETIALVHQNSHPFVFFWPFYYEADARKFHERHYALPQTRCYLAKMRSPLADTERRAAREAAAEEEFGHLNWPREGQTLTVRGQR